MQFNVIVTTFLLFASVNAFALLQFPQRILILEGKILIHEGEAYIAVNYKSNSETRIRLTGTIPKELFSQGGSNVVLKVNVTREFKSALGAGELISIVRFLDPFESPKVYNNERDLSSE